MIYFHNDYNRSCHVAVMNKLQATFSSPMPGYGTDAMCESAASKIRKMCENNDLSVHFLMGGTQTNMTVIAAALRPHQAVIAADSAHIHVHETGAVEATGHKILTIPSLDGKITAQQVETLALQFIQDENREHTVQPKMVYISNSTEWGTIYSLAELEALSAVCKKHGLYLFMDGARLGYALSAADNDVTMKDLARLTDVFYIGGTKQGALFGEAVVISNPFLAEDFRYIIKQHGGMLAKGWLLGLQFDALLEDGLYFKLAKQADDLADQIRKILLEFGFQLYLPSATNQVFAVVEDAFLPRLREGITFTAMGRIDSKHTIVRLCTSWATEQADVDMLKDFLMNFWV